MTRREHIKAAYILFIKLGIKKKINLRKLDGKTWNFFQGNISEMAYFFQRKTFIRRSRSRKCLWKAQQSSKLASFIIQVRSCLRGGAVIHTWINILIPKYNIKYFHFQSFNFEIWNAKKKQKGARFRRLQYAEFCIWCLKNINLFNVQKIVYFKRF